MSPSSISVYNQLAQMPTIPPSIPIGLPQVTPVEVTGEGFFNAIITLLVGLSTILGVFLLIKAGINLSTAGGDPNKLKEAKEEIGSVFSGLALVVLAVFIVKVVVKFVNEKLQ